MTERPAVRCLAVDYGLMVHEVDTATAFGLRFALPDYLVSSQGPKEQPACLQQRPGLDAADAGPLCRRAGWDDPSRRGQP